MKKITFVVVGILASLLLASTSVASADGNDDKIIIPNEWHGKHKVVIPHGDLVEVVYLRYADNPPAVASNPTIVDEGDWTSDPNFHNGYETSGFHWTSTGVSYVVNPSFATQKGLKQSDVVKAIQNSFGAWNGVVPKLYKYSGLNKAAQASIDAPDYKNLVTWASISPTNIVAVSIMWYWKSDLTLIDCDIVMNTYYGWGIDRDGEGLRYSLTDAFDIRDICTHEAGHWTGLNDLYDNLYLPMTMFGYASFGETYKISLEKGDKDGALNVFS